MPKSHHRLQATGKRVRREIIEMIGSAGSGHAGASLSAVVAQAVGQIHSCPMEFVEIQDAYAESGQPYELLEKYALTAPQIADTAGKVMGRKR